MEHHSIIVPMTRLLIVGLEGTILFCGHREASIWLVYTFSFGVYRVNNIVYKRIYNQHQLREQIIAAIATVTPRMSIPGRKLTIAQMFSEQQKNTILKFTSQSKKKNYYFLYLLV